MDFVKWRSFLVAIVAVLAWTDFVYAQADNDLFHNRIPLIGTDTVFEFHTRDSTTELSDPPDPYLSQGSIWYSWTAPSDGTLLVEPQVAANWAPLMRLFEGEEAEWLTSIECLGCNNQGRWNVKAGRVYSLALAPYAPHTEQRFHDGLLHLRFETAPDPATNDLFENRILLKGEKVAVRVSVEGVTLDAGERALFSNFSLGMVWYSWRAPASGYLDVRSTTLFHLYSGDQLSELLRESGSDAVTCLVQGGKEYHIALIATHLVEMRFEFEFVRRFEFEGISCGRHLVNSKIPLVPIGIESGDVVTQFRVSSSLQGEFLNTNQLVSLTTPELMAGSHDLRADVLCSNGRRYFAGPPYPYEQGYHLDVRWPNDDFEDAALLPAMFDELVVDTRGATSERGEDSAVCTRWWRWTAPFSLAVFFDGASVNGQELALLKGDSLSSLAPVPGNLVERGHTYYLRALSYRGSQIPAARYPFDVSRSPPENDAFSDRIAVPQSGFRHRVLLESATVENGEPRSTVGSGRSSVWYSFRAEQRGVLGWRFERVDGGTVSVSGRLGAYQGDSLVGLVPIAPIPSLTGFLLEAGQTCQLRVQDYSVDGTNHAWIAFSFIPSPGNDAFAERTSLEGDHLQWIAGVDGATAEAGEPKDLMGGESERSRWWTWTAPRDGYAVADVPEVSDYLGTPHALLDVFTGSTVGELRRVPLIPFKDFLLLFQVTQGASYQLRVSESSVAGGARRFGTNVFRFQLDMSDLSLSIVPSSPFYSLSAPPSLRPSGTLADEPGVEIALYKQAPGFSGSYPFRMRVLGVATNRFPHLDLPTSTLSPGIHDLVAVATDGQGRRNYALPLTLNLRPANDDFLLAQVITGRTVRLASSLASSTLEPGEPDPGAPGRNQSVWFLWKSPGEGIASVASNGGIRAYRGTRLDQLELVGWEGLVGQAYDFLVPVRPGDSLFLQLSSELKPGQERTPQFYNLTLDLLEPQVQLVAPVDRFFKLGDEVPMGMSVTGPSVDVREAGFVVDGEFISVPLRVPYETLVPDLSLGVHSLQALIRTSRGQTFSSSVTNFTIYATHGDSNSPLVLSETRQIVLPNFAEGAPTRSTLRSLWYQMRAVHDGFLLIKQESSTPFSGSLEVFTGSLDNRSPALPLGGQLATRGWATVPAAQGKDYFIHLTSSPFGLVRPLWIENVNTNGNDHFDHPDAISGTVFEVRSATFHATAETGELSPFGFPATRSVWWSWTSPLDGVLEVVSPWGLVVYTQNQSGVWRRSLSLKEAHSRFSVLAGVAYRFMVDGAELSVPDVRWTGHLFPKPANDDFINRIVLQGRHVRFSGSIGTASSEPGEPEMHYGGFGQTLWWTWVAPATGWATLREVESPVGSRDLKVYQGDRLTDLSFLVVGESTLSFQATEKQSYVIRSWGDTPVESTASWELFVEQSPPNDQFSARVRLEGAKTQTSGWIPGARREFGEPLHDGKYGGRSVWFAWRAPHSGRASLRLAGEPFSSLLAVYRGSEIQSLQPVASGSGDPAVEVQFDALGGTDYSFAVDATAFLGVDFGLQIELPSFETPVGLELITSANGSLILKVTRLAGREAFVEVSSDLHEWISVGDIASGQQTIELPLAAIGSREFFRVRTE